MKRLYSKVVLGLIISSTTWVACKSDNATKTKADETPAAADDGIGNDADIASLPSTSSFPDLWQKVKSSAYSGSLPDRGIKVEDLIESDFFSNAYRTLTSKADWIPGGFKKLVRPNGTCLKGTWTIDGDSKYGGYFKSGSVAQVIARGSVGFDEVGYDQNRAFGMAIKVFPTGKADDTTQYETANIFLIDDNAGHTKASYVESAMYNEPANSILDNLKEHLITIFTNSIYPHIETLVGMKIGQEIAESVGAKKTLNQSKVHGHSGIRQLYKVAELGTGRGEGDAAHDGTAPNNIRVKGISGKLSGVESGSDFRTDELDVSKYPNGQLVFEIAVGETKDSVQPIGKLTFTESVNSDGCDTKLHFHHPLWR